jgi:hypothetical protein
MGVPELEESCEAFKKERDRWAENVKKQQRAAPERI